MADCWQIEHSCPQCAAPVTLEETDRLFTCPFCRTRLYLTVKDLFRYYIPPGTAPDGELVYVPYWRIRGSLFCATGSEVTHRFVDTNTLAVNYPELPYSLGLRPQVLKIRFVLPTTKGRFLAPDLPAEQVLPGLVVSSHDSFYRNFIGETVSLIHAPLILRGDALNDAILDRPVAACSADEREGLLAAPPAPRGEIRFIPTLCPHCGWDMEGGRESLVLVCRNCSTAWSCPEHAFTPVEFTVMVPPPATREIALYLPFWRMRPRIEGIQLASYADLIRIANLPKAITPAFEEAPLIFRSPAFKLNPSIYSRLARQMTIMRPDGDEDLRLPASSLYPVTLPVSEAAEGIVITIAQMVRDKSHLHPRLSGLTVTLEEHRLEYHPFIPGRTEVRHASLQLAIDHTALTYGTRL